MNAQDAIVAAVLAALRSAPAVTTGPIEEDLDADAFDESVQQAVSISLTSTEPQSDTPVLGNPTDWVSTVQAECYARRDSRTTLGGRASRTLHAAVYARLMADAQLAGAADDIREPTIAIDGARRDTRMGCCTGVYPVWHRTHARTLGA